MANAVGVNLFSVYSLKYLKKKKSNWLQMICAISFKSFLILQPN